MQIRRRAGLRSFPLWPRSGSTCPASDQKRLVLSGSRPQCPQRFRRGPPVGPARQLPVFLPVPSFDKFLERIWQAGQLLLGPVRDGNAILRKGHHEQAFLFRLKGISIPLAIGASPLEDPAFVVGGETPIFTQSEEGNVCHASPHITAAQAVSRRGATGATKARAGEPAPVAPALAPTQNLEVGSLENIRGINTGHEQNAQFLSRFFAHWRTVPYTFAQGCTGWHSR